MEHPHIKIKPKTKIFLLEWLFIIVSNVILMYAYYFFTWWGLGPYLRTGIFNDYMNTGYIHLEIIVQGILFGMMFGLINFLVDNTKLRRKSFGTIILVKTFLYVIAMTLSGIFVFVIYHVFSIIPAEMINSIMLDYLSISFLMSASVYLIIMVLIINFILQINRKFGYGVLFSMIIGKYHKPRKERRIFMFLDMKDSTGNAERLGHYYYSRLIQSCIHDLTDLIIRYKAQVYQYVGDEVVLTWPSKKGAKDLNCINLFYAFEQRLIDRQKYYAEQYNIIPEFKAGLDEGIITVTEVGDIKREIAYHGEVLHTAARLEKMCNNLQKNVLITQNLVSILPAEDGFDKEFMGEFKLRGKELEEKVFGINRIA
jgi:adenylate cyclase